MNEGYIDLDEVVRDDNAMPFFAPGQGFRPDARKSEPLRITASPYVYREPHSIPPRQWLYGRHYIRGFVSTTVAPGGVGKTSLTLAEAVAMVTGRAILGGPKPKMLRVWVWNLEDPDVEIERRLAGIVLHYKIDARQEIEGKLFVDTGRSSSLVIASKLRDQTVVAEPLVEALIKEMLERRIDALIVDPFVSSHNVGENDNNAIDTVAKTWARIAHATGAAVELVHHVRKPATGTSAPFTVDDARGAVALIGAVRSARVLNVMSDDEAAKADVSPEHRREHFRVDDGKSNMRSPMEKAAWQRLLSVPLDNQTPEDEGDWIGVVTPWEMPGTFEGLSTQDLRNVQTKISQGEWAENVQANNWAGRAVAEVLAIDSSTSGGKQRIKAMLQTWIGNKALRVEYQHSARDGRDKPMIIVGEWV